MSFFTLYIEDLRYKVPTIEFVLVADEARARELAAERLARSANHAGVRVYEGDKLLFRVRRDATAEVSR